MKSEVIAMKTSTEIKKTLHGLISCLITVQMLLVGTAKAEVSAETVSNFAALPIISSQTAPPLVMLTMAKDHKLYYEAYNDASDLDGDGNIDIGYKPDAIDYYGYFDSYKCYEYNSTDARFEPQSITNNKKCSGSDEWSGDFLNYLIMSRMDALRKVFYGGQRSVDSATETELERSYIPQDAHSWGKEYKDIARDGYDIREYSPLDLPSGNKYHLFANTTLAGGGGQPLLRVLEDKNNRIWEWLSKERPVADNSLGTPTDYNVRVLVCVSSLPEKNCKQYPSGVYKPTGLLHTYGESDSMYFGLITGTYAKNTSGGVLRKKVGSISNEININTGQFLTGVNGIISTMDRLRIVEFRSGDHSYEPGWDGAWISTRPINEGEQPNWGNPIAEMMYEGVRYFAGKAAPTSDFSIATTGNQDASLGLPLDSWDDPYDATTGYPECSSPYQIVVSDINPSYDTDQVPGSYFNNFTGDVSGLNVETLADTISINEPSSTGMHFIGHSATNDDGAPSAKNVTSLGNIRGLSPEEPTKLGGYYSASVSYFAHNNDLNTATGGQKMNTFAVALASPLPSIEIPINGNTIALVPFAKSVGGCLGISGAQGDFQPTNQIVDFYAETVTPTSGKFRINYEDVEQGADHDMDAIVEYEYDVDTSAGTVDVTLNSTYAAGCVIQHMGYVISGTTQDGVYLEVRDADTSTDPDYFLDTPPGQGPGGTWNDGSALPLKTKRTFTPSGSSAATLLKDPLWYAAKWGGFVDKNNNGIPDLQTEWDNKNSFGLSLPDGNPDNYYLVANPLELERSLARVFDAITARTSSGTAAAVVANSRQGLGAVYQAIYEPLRRDASSREVNWIGTLHSLFLDEYGYLREDGDGDARLDGYTTDPVVELFYDDLSNTSKVRRYSSSDATNFTPSSSTTDSLKSLRTIWNAREELSTLTSVSSQRSYSSSAATGRYIFTWMDTDGDGIVDSTEVEDFDKTQISASNYGWLNEADETTAENLVDYMRGVEITGFRTRTIDYDDDGSAEVIRLGDIIHSTPTVVDTPAEAFDLLYGDANYGVFRKKYENRRRVVYVGANDGMLHAFNGGFYDVKNRQFSLQSPGGGTETSHPLGSELWAYVPMNLLPHLKWFAAADYPHVYYMDAKPRVFDAKIFDVGSGGVTGQSGGATTHPGGWGTVLVAGMRLGGGEITVDTAADGLGASDSDSDNSDDRTLSSSYVILDITDPEQPPALIAELRTPNLGFTTVYPTAFALRETDDSPNGWYLVFGTGPNDLATVTSDHAAELYVYDLYNQQFVSDFGPGDVTLETNSFLGDPVSVDWGLSYRADAVYFGTVNGSAASPGGKLYRLKINPDNTTANDNPTNWVGPDVLLDLGKPVVATPTVSVDKQDQHWVFVGTGRFFSSADKSSTAPQALYAVKDPGSSSVALSDLLNVTNATVFEDGTLEGTISGLTTPSTFHDLMDYIASSKKGWILKLPSGTDPSARVVNQSVLLGQVLLTTAYTPNTDICRAEGRSALYGLHFQTGTALPGTNTFGIGTATCSSCQTTQHELLRSVDIGVGLASSPSLHTIPGNSDSSSGSGSSGGSQTVKVFTQTSTGAIVAESAKVGGSLRSGEVSWREFE
jgi:type IV pilus assembly protein PilY1